MALGIGWEKLGDSWLNKAILIIEQKVNNFMKLSI